jgi:excisionase family DNA binding protein
MSDSPPPQKLLKPPEAAKMLAIGKTLLWQLTNCGEIPFVRVGRLLGYDVSDLRDWIDSHKTKGKI